MELHEAFVRSIAESLYDDAPRLIYADWLEEIGESDRAEFIPVQCELEPMREALLQAGRRDLIGSGCDCLIPANPPKEALQKRREQANEAVQGDHYHTVANPTKGEKPGERGADPVRPTGYRPGRKTQKRRKRK